MKIQLATKQIKLDKAKRVISGIATKYGVRASANYPVIIEPGALTISELSRVKLLLDHDPSKPVGYAIEASDDENQLYITFTVAETPLGDFALEQAALGLRDGLSVGFDLADDGWAWEEETQAFRVTAAQLHETSLVAIPAVDAARVTDVKASHNPAHPSKETPSMLTQEEVQNMIQAALTNQNNQPAPGNDEPGPVSAANPAPVKVTSNTTLSLRQVEAKIGDYIKAGLPLDGIGQVVAADGQGQYLTELTPDLDQDDNGNGIAYMRPQWIGEIWEASKDGRPFLETLGTPNRLTAPKMLGFRKKWSHPIVGPWDCSKPVPTGGVPELETVEVEAQGMAGAVAICRVWFDFGGSKIQDDWFAEAGKDYARQTEAYALGVALTEATQLQPAGSIPAALLSISSGASKLGFRIDHIRMGSQAWADYANLPADQVPWWLQKQGAVDIRDGKLSISPNLTAELAPELPPNTILAYDRRAFKFWETPWFRVTAHEIQERLGWINVGVFRYFALLVTDARAVLRIDITPTGANATHVIIDQLPVVDTEIIDQVDEVIVVNNANPNAPKK